MPTWPLWQVVLLGLVTLTCGAPTVQTKPFDAAQSPDASQSTIGPPKGELWQAPAGMPGGDEWYRPQVGYEEKKPGDILKWRTVPKGLTVFNNNKTILLQGAWQIQYRTTDSIGQPDATVVTVLAPHHAKKNSLFVYHWFSDATFQE